jgi:putative SOS response-associated peptidase YedK
VYIDIDELELQEIVREAEKKARELPGEIKMKTGGEIFPTDTVPVRTGLHQYQPMKWGFTRFDGKPVINARSETALEKPMFRKPMLGQRCLVPASGYYEWQKVEGISKKIKYLFHIPGAPMYFAGCFRQEKDSPLGRFVILTRQAAGGTESIHDRMPVILPEKHIEAWLNEGPEVPADTITALTWRTA